MIFFNCHFINFLILATYYGNSRKILKVNNAQNYLFRSYFPNCQMDTGMCICRLAEKGMYLRTHKAPRHRDQVGLHNVDLNQAKSKILRIVVDYNNERIIIVESWISSLLIHHFYLLRWGPKHKNLQMFYKLFIALIFSVF